MMKLILFFSLIVSAYASEKRIFSVGDLMIMFEEVDGYYVNSTCKNKKCEAYFKAVKFEKKNVSPDLLIGGKNPASVKCSTILGGKVIIAEDNSGDKQSLCWFPDNSYLQH